MAIDPNNRDLPTPAADPLEDLVEAYDELLARQSLDDRPERLGPSPDLDSQFERLQAVLEALDRARPRAGTLSPDAPSADSTPSDVAASSAALVDTLTDDDPVPARLGRFEIVRELGRGGHAVVFLARDPALGRLVALKVLRPELMISTAARRRFLREGRASASLEHPHLVSLYEAGTIGPICYLAQAYCPGRTLAEWLARLGPAPPRIAAEIVACLADAMYYAHHRGVLHRDLKPGNILLDREVPEPSEAVREIRTWAELSGSSHATSWVAVPRITDFGLARIEGAADQTATGLRLGTPAYMAPEQVEGRSDDVGPCTDVYGLGAVMYELLTGLPPASGESTAEVLRKILLNEPRSIRDQRRDVPKDLEAICARCLEKIPARRYESAGDLDRDLRRFLAGEPTRARPVGPLGQLRRWARRRPLVAALLSAVVLISSCMIGGTIWYSRNLRAALADVRATEKRLSERQVALDRSKAALDRSQAESARHERAAGGLRYANDIREAFQGHLTGNVSQGLELLEPYADGGPWSELRGFEWSFVRGSLDQSARTLMTPHREAFAVAFAPDRPILATGGQDGSIIYWDAVSGRQLAAWQAHESCVNELRFTPDGKLLVSASCDRTVCIWDSEQRSVVNRFPQSSIASDLDIDPGGRFLAAGLDGGEIVLWNLPSCQEAIRFTAEVVTIDDLAFDRSGKWLFTSRGISNAHMWNTSNGSLVAEIPGHAFGLAVSPIAPHVALAARHGLAVWNWETRVMAPFERVNFDELVAVTFTPDGRYVVASGHDGNINVFDAVSGRQRSTLSGHAGRKCNLAIDAAGRTLASAGFDGQVRLWDLNVLEPRIRLDVHDNRKPGIDHVESVVFSPDLQRLSTVTGTGFLETWDLQETSRLSRETSQTQIRGLAWSTHANGPVAVEELADHRLRVTVGGQPAGSLECPSSAWLDVEISGDARTIAALDSTDRLCVAEIGANRWHWQSSWDPWNAPAETAHLNRIRLRHDGKMAAVSMAGRPLTLVDLTSGACVETSLSERPDMALSRDGRWLAAAAEHELRFVEVATQRVVTVPWDPEEFSALEFSADSRTLACGTLTGSILLYHVPSAKKMLRLRDLPGAIVALRVAEDGKSLAAVVVPPEAQAEVHVLATGSPKP